MARTPRDRIDAVALVRMLQACALGERELTPTQVRAAQTLLDKVLPDLKAVEHSGEAAVNWKLRLT